MTSKYHVVLSGNKPGTRAPWTAAACPYPPAFAGAGARLLTQSVDQYELFSLTKAACLT